MRSVLLFYCLLTALTACREPISEGHDAHGPQAVLESSPSEGFRLAPQALRTLGIETTPLKQGRIEEIPRSALVYYQDEVGVYRLRDGWFRLVPLDAPEELRPGDSVATQGAAYLRVTDMSLFGEQQSGHHH